MIKICHVCNKDAEWIVQSPNLQYFYCKTCKVEPIELPTLQEPYRRDDEMPGMDPMHQGHMIRYSIDNGFEYSSDGANWHSADYDDDNNDSSNDPYDSYGFLRYETVTTFYAHDKPTDEELRVEFEQILKAKDDADEQLMFDFEQLTKKEPSND